MAAKASDKIRRATTFLLAVCLWLHALFFLDIQSTLLSKFTQVLHFNASEVVLFALLFIFSSLSASGFWRMFRSLVYIYFFPFILLWYVFYCCALMLRAINRWFNDQRYPQHGNIEHSASVAAPVVATSSDGRVGAKTKAVKLLHFLLQPFQRFMILWCVLLLVTTHSAVLWLCLVVVLVQLARKMFLILKILLASDTWFKKYGPLLFAGLTKSLAALEAVTPDTNASNELKSLWGQLNLWRKILTFLNDPYLMSRWAWVLGIFVFGSIYTYIAVLFSFAYYGIARVSGAFYPWPDAMIASVFIPFFVSELPKIRAIQLLGGIQCTLVVVIGIGTVVNFLRRKLDAVRNVAADLSNRFANQSIREKYKILEEKFATSESSVSTTKSAEK